jgi:uncharacterized membrane protein
MIDPERQGLRQEIESLRLQLETLADRLSAIEAREINSATPLNRQQNGDHAQVNESPEARAATEPAPVAQSEEEVVGPGQSLTEALLAARSKAGKKADVAFASTDAAAIDLAAGGVTRPALVLDRTSPVEPKRKQIDRRGLSNWEWMIGAKGIALVGVLILVIAAGLFFKEVWDRGLLAAIPNWVRCALGGGFGIVLVGLGEIFRRKINPLASSGVSAAGIAIIFGSILAAAQLYELVTIPVAFILLTLTTITGVGLGALSSRVLLAGLSLMGAFAVPLVLATGEPSHVVMPVYLISLLALGLVLAGWKGLKYSPIRRIAWWGTALLGSLWVFSVRESAPVNALILIGTVWGMTFCELIASSRFLSKFRTDRAWPEQARHGITRRPEADGSESYELNLRALLAPEARWINAVFGVTAWTVIAAGVVVYAWKPSLDWLVPCVLGIASGAIVLGCRTRWQSPWLTTATPLSALVSALILNAAALGALAIATGLTGAMQVVAWAFIGLAAVVYGTRLRFHAANVFGLLLLATAFARVITIDFWYAAGPYLDDPVRPIFSVLGIAVTDWTVLMLLVAASIAAADVLQRRKAFRPMTAVAAVILGALAWIGPGSEAMSVGVAWAILAVGIGWLASRFQRMELRISGFVAICSGMAVALVGALPSLSIATQNAFKIAWADTSSVFLIIGLCAVAMSALPRLRPELRCFSSGLAWVSFAVVVIGDGTPQQMVMLCWAGLALLMLAVGIWPSRKIQGRSRPVFRRWLLPQLAVGIAACYTVLWIVWQEQINWSLIVSPPLLHPAFASGMIAALTLGLGSWQLKHTRRIPGLRWNQTAVNTGLSVIGSIACGFMVLIVTSAEAHRVVERMFPADTTAPSAALSIWWSVFATTLIVLGIRSRSRGLRWSGLALLGISAAKVMLFDLATLEGIARIVGTAVVGMVLLSAGVVYAWLTKSLDGRDGTSQQEAGVEELEQG